ncbi:vesicle-trafficking protein SEC22b isoform X1 [Dermacentor andersoni]|uniref:vesicle-trafficking protein SEC22b isoform X1 n=1 Tax=Dermacentor andersoni TaxID=34620 RepID=UPI0024160B0C|nr:vesicle-trafficking protein SEC22b-like isoform X1 [Dermacentor andersoni]
MVLMTMIARVADGLPLSASVQDDQQQLGVGNTEYQNQAKMLFKKLNNQSFSRSTIETGPYNFHYMIENGVCYLVLTEKSFSKRLAFSFLEDLQNEFNSQYGSRVNSVNRPYSFIEFDTYIQKAKKAFMDSRARRNLSSLNSELQDVQRIMVQNIDDVLQRGSVISVAQPHRIPLYLSLLLATCQPIRQDKLLKSWTVRPATCPFCHRSTRRMQDI